MTTTAEPVGAATVGATPPTGPRLDRKKFNWGTWPLLLPAFGLLLVLFLLPVIYSFYIGFTNLKLVGPTSINFDFTGLENVQRLVSDAVFHKSIVLTAIFVFGSGVIVTTLVALVLALAMQKGLAGLSTFAGAIVLAAFVLPPVTIAIVWYAASIPGGGMSLLIGNPEADLLNSAPMLAVSAANAWSLTGIAMLMFGAALRNIPGDIIEAAQLENAGPWTRFRRITLPLLRPTIMTTILLVSLLSLANFTIVYLMTGGGPGTDTMILPVYAYQQAFRFNDLSYGALIGNVMVVFAAVVAAIFVRLGRTDD
jgi:multiple sugar transport system permease protein